MSRFQISAEEYTAIKAHGINQRVWLFRKTSLLLGIPPYTPEMNPIEQIWKQLRSMGFRNEVFKSLDDIVDRLCDTICSLTNEMVKSISCRQWITNAFFT